jgi:Mg2+ and Co2+ transporter CorA
MEASNLFTRKAQESADRMEKITVEMHEIARKTKQETVSMKIITVVTLFFLPGTFMSVS